jgi:hypothetical protein
MKGSRPLPELPKSLTEEKAKKQSKKGPRPIVPLPKPKEIGKFHPKMVAQPNVYVNGKLEKPTLFRLSSTLDRETSRENSVPL